MKILINNVYSYRNRGDSAIVEATAKWFERNVKDAEIYLLSQYWEDNEAYYDEFGWESVPMLWDIPMTSNKVRRLLLAGGKFMGMLFALLFVRKRRSTHDANWLYKNCDLLIDAGGGALYSSNQYVFYLGLYQHLVNLFAGVLCGTKVVIAPQSIGPLYRWHDIVAVKYVIRKLDVVFVREKISKEFLEQLKVPCELAPDCAFLGAYLREVTQEADKLCQAINCADHLKIGLTVLNWNWAAARGLDSEEGMATYLRKIAKTMKLIAEGRELKVYLYSHADVEHTVSDYVVSCEMASLLEGEGVEAQVVSPEFTASDLHHLYSEMDVIVGSRMHSCIISLMAGTPVVALAYQPKSLGVLSLCGMEDHVCDAYSFEVDDLFERVNFCINDLESQEENVSRCADEIQHQVDDAFTRMMVVTGNKDELKS